MKSKRMYAVLILLLGIGVLNARDLKVLMIGNSFSRSLTDCLPHVVRSVPGHTLELTSAYIGGCTLDRHCENLKKAESDPEYKPYLISQFYSDPERKPNQFNGNIDVLLKNNRYDIVTIQQASAKSWNYPLWQPYADDLIAYIRKHQPDAEIVLHQTWSYRCDDPHLKPNPRASWNFDQTGMYERIRDAYRTLAEKYKFRVIPMGDAVQKFRQLTPVKFRTPSEKFEYPNLPSAEGDVVGNAWWGKDAKTGERVLRYDWIHLNASGRYLQACVWFAFLYGEPADKIAFVPKGMSKEASSLLHKCAQEAVSGYEQVK